MKEILSYDRNRLLAEMRRTERALNETCAGESDSPACDSLLREYHMLEGVLEIYEGTQNQDLFDHYLTDQLLFSSGDGTGRDLLAD